MFKNLSIRQISTYLVLVLGILNLLILIIVTGIDFFQLHLGKIALAFFIGSILSYFIILFLLDRYIFRKIKVIYKIIHKSKLDDKVTSDIDIRGKSIELVNEEVIAWAEDTQEQLKTAKSLAAYRKNFVGNVSHELKTPIFSIQGYLHTLLDGGIYDENINIKFLKRAADNTDRLKTIVDDLEAISRLESGELSLSMEKIDIRKTAYSVMQDLEAMANEKSITLSFKDPSNLTFSVLGDVNAIRQVLTNLIVNSIKYGKENGHTVISFYDIDDNVLIEVSDNGIGIQEEHLDHLFDRFYRVDESRSRDAGGSGLGLSIVKHIIEAHGQNINVRSTPDIGSTFGFTLRKTKL